MLGPMAQGIPRAEQIQILLKRIQGGGYDSTTARLLDTCIDEFGLSPMEGHKRIKEAKLKHAKGIDSIDRSEETATTLARFEAIYEGAMRDSDWTAATKALQGICGMLGLKP